ncbi:hypothetical protein DM806_26695 [Sphingobium lactosutens]|nr:hypothetical protein [Sphingobium lactosutens]
MVREANSNPAREGGVPALLGCNHQHSTELITVRLGNTHVKIRLERAQPSIGFCDLLAKLRRTRRPAMSLHITTDQHDPTCRYDAVATAFGIGVRTAYLEVVSPGCSAQSGFQSRMSQLAKHITALGFFDKLIRETVGFCESGIGSALEVENKVARVGRNEPIHALAHFFASIYVLR